MPSKSYEKALSEIYSLDKFGIHLGLERIKRILALLGNPEKSFRCCLVAGSNGKGSTVEMLGSVLSKNGWKTGSYFSPQVEEFPERIRINGKNADRKDIVASYLEVKKACSKNDIQATFFEVVTAMALLIFSWRKVKCAVLEVGLGGRQDATNACEPEVSAITSISLEHTDILGKTEEEIVHEKCGIARKGRALIVGQVNSQVCAAIEKECAAIGAKPIFVSDAVKISALGSRGGKYSYRARLGGNSYRISLAAPGKFQVNNSLVALACAVHLGAKKPAIQKGLSSSCPAYRLQTLSHSPKVIADCCHNPGAAFAIAHELRRIKGRKVLLFSAMSDKDYKQVLDILRPFFSQLVLTEVPLARAASIQELADAARRCRFMPIEVKYPGKALIQAKRIAGKEGTVVIAGSIYLLAGLFGKDKIRIAQ